MPVSDAKTVTVTIIIISFLGGLIVTATKWAINTSSSHTNTVNTKEFSPEIGNLTLTATIVKEKEILLNLTFNGTITVNQPGYVWTICISNSSIPNYNNLPKGLQLVEGTIMTNASCLIPSYSLSLQATLRAIEDGEWTIYGKFIASAGTGFLMSRSTKGIQITVSNGSILEMKEEEYPCVPPGPSGSENQKVNSPY